MTDAQLAERIPERPDVPRHKPPALDPATLQRVRDAIKAL
jgi:hypothetical protein